MKKVNVLTLILILSFLYFLSNLQRFNRMSPIICSQVAEISMITIMVGIREGVVNRHHPTCRVAVDDMHEL